MASSNAFREEGQDAGALDRRRKLHALPCHHNLDHYLEAYIAAAGIEGDPKGPLFRTALNRSGQALTGNALRQEDAYRMIRRRAQAGGIRTRIGNHSFRATGITAYLSNGGKLEVAQAMANYESARTTGLYDRRGDDVSLDEVERIGIRKLSKRVQFGPMNFRDKSCYLL